MAICKNVFWKVNILFVLLYLISMNGYGQIRVEHVVGMLPQTFVETYVADQGMKVSNVKYNGSADAIQNDQIGLFTNDTLFTAIQFRGGFLLTTGSILLAQTPNHGTYSCGSEFTDISPLQDPFILDVFRKQMDTPTVAIRGGALLEFDFESVSPEIQFDYVFASEEYEQHVCTYDADVFGAYVTGPDPENPDSVITRTITLVPGTNLPVGVNTINNGMKGIYAKHNCEYPRNSLAYVRYYISNMPSNPNGPYHYYTDYNGFTVKLKAKATVIPCKTYRIRIGIANLADGFADSGVLIGKKGFRSTLLKYELSGDMPNLEDAIEGCNRIKVLLHSIHALSTQTKISVTTGGTAVEGVDYKPVTGNYNMTMPTDTLSFLIDPIFDNVQKPDRYVVLYLHSKFYAGNNILMNEQYDTILVWIRENDYVVLKTPEVPPSCNGDVEMFLKIEKLQGLNDLQVTWTPKTGISKPFSLATDIYVTKTTDYQVVAKDKYGCFSDTVNFKIVVTKFPILSSTIHPTSGCIPLTCEFYAEVDPPGTNLVWKIDDKEVSNNSDFMETYTEEGIHRVMVSAYIEPECTVSMRDTIFIEDCTALEINVPNIFTPNGDGFNDTFKPDIKGGEKITEYNMYIYDRWGRLLFSTQDYNAGWDGGNYADGIYFCTIEYSDKNSKHDMFTTTITLLRK